MEDDENIMARFRREAAVDRALARAPGGAVTLLNPKPAAWVRVCYGRAIAFTSTHVLHEWVRWGEYQCRWDEKWQVERVDESKMAGDPLDELPSYLPDFGHKNSPH